MAAPERPDPDALLARVMEEETRAGRGRHAEWWQDVEELLATGIGV